MKRVVKLVLAVGIVAAVASALRKRPAPPTASPTAPPTRPDRPGPVEAPLVTPSAAAGEPPSKDVAPAWVDATGERTCPEGYPVKAKLSSKVFHVPGGAFYEGSVPDRCYASAEAAEADGFRASKR